METIEAKKNNLNGCILIPAFNEEKHLGSVVEVASKFLPVIVIDDGSIDRTVEIATKAGAIVFQQNPNQGKGAALQRGFSEVLKKDYDFLITLDADGQHNPQEIKLFLDSFLCEKKDLIIGYRDFSKMPLVRKLANISGGWLFSWAVRKKIMDNQSGYRLMSKELVNVVLDSNEHGYEYEVEIIVRCIQSGLKLGWVPIETIYGDEVSHIRPFKHFKNFLTLVLKTRKRMNLS
jgi:glycosyltransferase involved in cell wall biosynthesis